MTGSRWLAGLSAVGTLMAAPAFGEEAIPVGPEFQVSRGNTGYGYKDGYAYNVDVSRAQLDPGTRRGSN